jgi:fimbrial isopeptide formation D2 family protein
MFNQLLSNLPFNPSLIDQVAFYTKRLKQETSVRRLGFILVLLVLLVQLFAVFSPAQPSLAASGSDLLPGGFSSKDELKQLCTANVHDYGTILAHFGISCDNLSRATVTTIKSNEDNNQYYATARQPVGQTNIATGKATDETSVVVSGLNESLYSRKLSSWDNHSASNYKALAVKDDAGGQHYILYSCGNVVQPGKPKPNPPLTPTPPPFSPISSKPCAAAKDVDDSEACIAVSKHARNITQNIADANNTTAKAGDFIEYTLTVNNNANVPIKNYVLRDDLSDVLDYADVVDLGGASQDSQAVLTWPASTLAAFASSQQQVTVRVKDPVPKTPQPCAASVSPCPGSNSYDLVMSNVLGNSINIRVQAPVAKSVEIETTKILPDTGPGMGIFAVFAVTTVVGYFYARSRLMTKELEIVKSEYTSSGGI